MVIKLNRLRHVDAARASKLSKQILDNTLMASGIPFDVNVSSERNLQIFDDYLQMKVNKLPKRI